MVPMKDNTNSEARSVTLSDRDRDIFLAMLNADAEPNAALKEAVECHKRLISEKDEPDWGNNNG